MSRLSRRTEIPEPDRPREKLLANGAAALTDQKLMAALLGKGSPQMDDMTLAGKLVRVIGEQRPGVRAEDLRGLGGVGDPRATRILAVLAFSRRRIKPEGVSIEAPTDLLPHVRRDVDRKQEQFLCASINGANEILNIRVVSVGLIDRTPKRKGSSKESDPFNSGPCRTGSKAAASRPVPQRPCCVSPSGIPRCCGNWRRREARTQQPMEGLHALLLSPPVH